MAIKYGVAGRKAFWRTTMDNESGRSGNHSHTQTHTHSSFPHFLLLNNSWQEVLIIHGNNMTRATSVFSGERQWMNKWVNEWKTERMKWRHPQWKGGSAFLLTEDFRSGFCCFGHVSNNKFGVWVQIKDLSSVYLPVFHLSFHLQLSNRSTTLPKIYMSITAAWRHIWITQKDNTSSSSREFQ